MEDIQEVMFYEPGITVSGIDAKDGKKPTAKFTIAPDARLGEYSVRVRTATGLTELCSFFVGQFPTVAEKEPNNTFDQPQAATMNTTIAGVADNEDEDFYLVPLKKGQRLSVEAHACPLDVGQHPNQRHLQLAIHRFQVIGDEQWRQPMGELSGQVGALAGVVEQRVRRQPRERDCFCAAPADVLFGQRLVTKVLE